jgi:AcrR family transcriptional regulator
MSGTADATVPSTDVDPLRDRLLDAAVRVFARQGYAGTKIMDIVREAGLSTGAVYGRFQSKADLLREAVTSRTRAVTRLGITPPQRVAEVITAGATATKGPLTDDEAARLEAFVAARREPEIAAALKDARRGWRAELQPLIDAAITDGTVAPDIDPEAVVFFVYTFHLGLLLQRAAGAKRPDPAAWQGLIERIVASFGSPDPRKAVIDDDN